jgi:flavin reductase ActVB
VTDYADLDLDPRAVLGGYVEADMFLREGAEPATVDAEVFKDAMRLLASGVVMVTARVGERLWGLTISACCSISASPPRVLISLSRQASCRAAVLETRRFGLSILRADQKELAELGAVPGGPKYVDAFRATGVRGAGSTMIAGALYHLDCSVDRVFEVGDHSLIIGRVETAAPGDPGGGRDPLVYFDREFHSLAGGAE